MKSEVPPTNRVAGRRGSHCFQNNRIISEGSSVSILAVLREESAVNEPELNPTPRHGSRNVFCPHYDECLDLAINRGWMSWHCDLCEERSNHAARPEPVLSVNYSVAYYEFAARR